MHALEHWALQQGMRSKLYTTRAGKIAGGQMFSRGALFHLLRNRTYLGLIVHKDKTHPGLHPAIIEPDLFDAVEAKLNANKRRIETPKPHQVRAPLVGRIFDSDGEPMSPSFTRGKRGQPYRYYVSAPLQQGRRSHDDNGMRRVAGPTLEAMIGTIIRRVAPKATDPLSVLTRVEVYADTLQLLMPVGMITTVRTRLDENETVAADPANPAWLRLTIPVRMRLHGGRSWILGGTAPPTRRDPALIKALRAAHGLLKTDRFDLPTLEAAPTSPYCRNIIRLALLAPELQRAILAGRQPPGLTLQSLKDVEIPSLWSEQDEMIASLSVPAAQSAARHEEPQRVP